MIAEHRVRVLLFAVPMLLGIAPLMASHSLAATLAAQPEVLCQFATGQDIDWKHPEFLEPVLDRIGVSALATASAQELPIGDQFAFDLVRVSIAGEAETPPLRQGGPVLLLVERGLVTVFVANRPHRAAPLAAGESDLVERNSLLKLSNESSEPAQVLVLGLLPPEGQLLIGAFGDPPGAVADPSSQIERTNERLFYAEIGKIERKATRLFMACLHWTDPAGAIKPTQFPGPVAILGIQDQILVNNANRILGGDCWLVPTGFPMWAGAGSGVPSFLFFGAWTDTKSPRIDPSFGANETSELESLDCETSTENGAGA